MPTTRRRRSRSRIVTTLAGLSINQKLALLVAWHPPRNDFERSRPATFRDYAEVRDVYARFARSSSSDSAPSHSPKPRRGGACPP